MAVGFDASFEAGNGLFAGSGGDWVAFAADRRTGPRAMWFYFHLSSIHADAVTCTMVNPAECLGGAQSYTAARPVYSYDGTRWFRATSARVDEERGEFKFSIPTPREDVWVAHCYPYTLTDVYALADRVAASPHACAEVLCRSGGGRDVPLLCIGEGAERFIWLCARSHAAETPGAFVLEGMVNRLLQDAPEPSYVRETATVYVVPAIDPDGVSSGAYGKDQAPVDFNRDYVGPSVHPEVAAVRERVKSLCATSRLALYLDSHAPCVHEHNFVLMPRKRLLGLDSLGREAAFCAELERRSPALCPLRADACAESSYMGDAERSSKDYFAAEYGCLSLTVESSYNRTAAGNYTTPDGLRALGAAVTDTCAEYLRTGDV
ncbi:MAG TPA: hypothetical protein DGT21_12660 [Armatimonadetes bacterium]|jgi:hypothetical protein|nr:hypothetical protein [Armatimonadota bacterium]